MIAFFSKIVTSVVVSVSAFFGLHQEVVIAPSAPVTSTTTSSVAATTTATSSTSVSIKAPVVKKTTPVAPPPTTPHAPLYTNPPLVPKLAVLSPNGGESYTSGIGSIRVTYSSFNLPGQVLSVRLESPTYGTMRQAKENVGDNIIASQDSIDIDLVKAGADPEGQYKIVLCADSVTDPVTPGKPLCDSSDNYFTLSAPSSKPPTISSIFPPETQVTPGYDNTVYIKGSNFDTYTTINIDGKQNILPSAYALTNSTALHFELPNNLSVGTHVIRVGRQKTDSSRVDLSDSWVWFTAITSFGSFPYSGAEMKVGDIYGDISSFFTISVVSVNRAAGTAKVVMTGSDCTSKACTSTSTAPPTFTLSIDKPVTYGGHTVTLTKLSSSTATIDIE